MTAKALRLSSDVDISEDEINIHKDLLTILLKDRTTNKNIIWATNDYSEMGSFYDAKKEITIDLITGVNSKIIQPRITKMQHQQINRTREKAEVFTPSWICNEQNNLIDEQWFGRKDVFNTSHDKKWKTATEKIAFPKSKTWKDYIDSNRLEISCGEAPYLVSRYDTVTGKSIKLQNRIGLLDRKLRIVNENTDDEIEWFKWTVRAFQSIYGYEYQGDNLLLARENLLYTFVDNIKYKLNRKPTLEELKKIATIISWNIWQMDGITNATPLGAIPDDEMQIFWFEVLPKEDNASFCKIKDWRSKKIIEFVSLMKGQMK